MKQMPVESFWRGSAGRLRARGAAPRSFPARRPGTARAQAAAGSAGAGSSSDPCLRPCPSGAEGVTRETDSRVMTGGDLLRAQAHGVVQEGLELDLGVCTARRGLGVRPAAYSRRKSANTRSLYSAAKLTASSSMPMTSAAARRPTRSSRVEQYSSLSSSSQFFMKRPVTSWPALFRSSAATRGVPRRRTGRPLPSREPPRKELRAG